MGLKASGLQYKPPWQRWRGQKSTGKVLVALEVVRVMSMHHGSKTRMEIRSPKDKSGQVDQVLVTTVMRLNALKMRRYQHPLHTRRKSRNPKIAILICRIELRYQVAGELPKGGQHEQPSLLSLPDAIYTSKPVLTPHRTVHLNKHDFSPYGGARNNNSRSLGHEEASQIPAVGVQPSTELPDPSLTPRSADVSRTRARIYSKNPTPGFVRLTRSATTSTTTGCTDNRADPVSQGKHVTVSGVKADRRRSRASDTESRTHLSEEQGGFGTTTQDAENDTKMATIDLGRKVEHGQALKALRDEILEDLTKSRPGFMELVYATSEDSKKLGELKFELQGFQKQLLTCEYEAAQLERRIAWHIERADENDKSCQAFAAMIERAEAKHSKIEKGLQALVGALGVQ